MHFKPDKDVQPNAEVNYVSNHRVTDRLTTQDIFRGEKYQFNFKPNYMKNRVFSKMHKYFLVY